MGRIWPNVLVLLASFCNRKVPILWGLSRTKLVRHEALEIERDAHAVSRERTPESKKVSWKPLLFATAPAKRGAARARTGLIETASSRWAMSVIRRRVSDSGRTSRQVREGP